MGEQRILVASQNSIKAAAVSDAMMRFNGSSYEVNLFEKDIDSGVSDQPLSLLETALGALNRLNVIRKTGGYTYYVAIEGGAHSLELPGGTVWFENACAAITDDEETSKPSIAYGPAYPIPTAIARHLPEGLDLNQAMEIETGIENIGSSHGFNGWLTDNNLNRQAGTAQAVLLALYGFIKS